MKQHKINEQMRKEHPAITSDAREQQLIAKAERLAEQKIEDGTASPQIILHYLKLGTTREAIEREILEKQKDLITAKTEALQSAKRIEELYEDAMNMFKLYRGVEEEETRD